MARPKSPVPSYCLHRQSGRAYVAFDGKQNMLPGTFDSAESRAAYDKLVAEYLRNGRTLPPAPRGAVRLTQRSAGFTAVGDTGLEPVTSSVSWVVGTTTKVP